MKIQGKLIRNTNQVIDKQLFDFKVESSFSPNNLWIISFNNGYCENGIVYDSAHYLKVLSVFNANLEYEGCSISATILCFISDAADIDYTVWALKSNDFTCFENDSFDFHIGTNNLIDLDALQVNKEFKDKDFMECMALLQELDKEHRDLYLYSSIYKIHGANEYKNRLDFEKAVGIY